MRFLTGHSRTSQFLKKWAGGSDLITVKHYFWSPGTSIQKSQEGLFRSLLHQILHQRRELIPVVCADRWDSSFKDARDPWSRIQLVEALQRLGGLDDVGWKICLFIDGLDEYSGDRTRLIEVIRKIGDSDKIKICTSSRPWLEFSDAFGGRDCQWKLHLQEYTRGDIQQFVKDELQGSADFDRLQKRDRVAAGNIVGEITERAQGVFLWVFLVVRSLLRGLCYADDISDLQRRLRELPDDLYEYFDRMLNSIEAVYRENVARLFLTMAYAKSTLPVLTFYFIDVGNTPLDKEPLPFLRTWPNVEPEKLDILDLKKRQLIARCKDLIHITSYPNAPIIFAEQVSFLHRTVFDFFRTAEVNNRLLELAGGTNFTPSKILLRAGIGQTRSLLHLRRLTYIKPYLQQWILGSLFYAHLIEVSDGIAQVDVLDELRDIIMEAYKIWGFSHAMEDLFDLSRINTFLELACRCDLALYVSQKYPDHTPKTLDRIAPGWKKLLQFHQDADFDFMISEKQADDDLGDEWRLGRHFELAPLQTSAPTLKIQQEESAATKETEPQVQISAQLGIGGEREPRQVPASTLLGIGIERVKRQVKTSAELGIGERVNGSSPKDKKGTFNKLRQLFRRR